MALGTSTSSPSLACNESEGRNDGRGKKGRKKEGLRYRLSLVLTKAKTETREGEKKVFDKDARRNKGRKREGREGRKEGRKAGRNKGIDWLMKFV